MGVNLKELFDRKIVSFKDLSNKIIIVDGYNMLYQFLTTIRGPDGSVFTNKKGEVTSHIIGLFSRVTKLMLENIKLAFVFDGKPPAIKNQEIEKRIKAKTQAKIAFEKAEKEEDVDSMKKFAGRTAKLTKPMVDTAKKLLIALGIPFVDAPSEGEAQASFMVKRGDGWAVASQDYDSLLYASPRVIQNLSITGRRKLPRKYAYITVHPELIELEPNLKKLELSVDQLKFLSILVGTDYNPKGVRGIGPKKALVLVKKYNTPEEIFKEAGIEDKEWKLIKKTFDEMPVNKDYNLVWNNIDKDAVKDLLINNLGFQEERVNNTLDKFNKSHQKNLGAFM